MKRTLEQEAARKHRQSISFNQQRQKCAECPNIVGIGLFEKGERLCHACRTQKEEDVKKDAREEFLRFLMEHEDDIRQLIHGLDK